MKFTCLCGIDSFVSVDVFGFSFSSLELSCLNYGCCKILTLLKFYTNASLVCIMYSKNSSACPIRLMSSDVMACRKLQIWCSRNEI